MPKVVSNTTPLINLSKISRVDLLQKFYGKIYVPFGVYQEIEEGRNKDYYFDISTIGWIEIIKIKHRKTLDYLIDLDKGEAETIILAREQNADLVIIDEKMGRFYARYYNLRVTGTLGVLLKAKKEGHLTLIKPFLEELRDKNTWLSENLFKEVLNLAGE